jgi:hypothetical protein
MRKVNRSLGGIVTIGLVAGLSGMSWSPVHGQDALDQDVRGPRTLRASGRPVIPMFEGYFESEDGGYELCFGYFNLNTEEALEIPMGPDNFIEPREFDGMQPTHFDPVPFHYRRHWCVMTVHVPESWRDGDQEVRWTLRRDGRSYSSPGYPRVHGYGLDELESPSRAYQWQRLIDDAEPNTNVVQLGAGNAQGSTAPVLRFLDPVGPEIHGRGGTVVGPVTVVVGAPLTLSVAVWEPSHRPARYWVGWWKHQGPGDVRFSQPELEAGPEEVLKSEIEEYQANPPDPLVENRATTVAIFSAPGTYLLRVQAIENLNAFERVCCWTNGYVEVTVRQ